MTQVQIDVGFSTEKIDKGYSSFYFAFGSESLDIFEGLPTAAAQRIRNEKWS